jgi:hypothetical protein
MSKNKVWALVGVAMLFGSLAIMQTMTARLAVAQEPNPTPTPKPSETPPPQACASCCGLMMPGGKTISGPAMDVLEFSDSGTLRNLLFSANRPVEICVTVADTSEVSPFHSQRMLVRLISGSSTVEAISVRPGNTRTACGRAQYVTIDCNPEDPSAGPCSFKWRVDGN